LAVFYKVVYGLQKFFLYLCGIFLGLLALVTFYEVVARYIFNAPTIWANDVSTVMLRFIVFFSMGVLLIEGRHIRITFLADRLKGVAQKAVNILTMLCILPYAYVMVEYGIKLTQNAIKMKMLSPGLLGVPLWIPYMFIPICGVLLALAVVCTVFKIIIGKQEWVKGGE